jgi:hypothetical protein
MTQAEKSIVFAAQFEIGEKVTPTHKKIVKDALKIRVERNADLAILVGDIGVPQKLSDYIKNGTTGLKEGYVRRIRGASTGCVISQLPEEGRLDEFIEPVVFDKAVKMLEEYDSTIISEIKGVDFTNLNEKTRMKLFNFIKKNITPELMLDRLEIHGLKLKDVKIYSERRLKNQVSFKMRPERKNRKNNWLPIIDKIEKLNPLGWLIFTEVKKGGKAPACRGIMLDLYEEISVEGYTTIIQLYPKNYELALRNAQDLYDILQKEFPDDPRWKLKFEYNFY